MKVLKVKNELKSITFENSEWRKLELAKVLEAVNEEFPYIAILFFQDTL